ncbi:MAG: hypothetical protein ACK4FV_06245 [Candidatus Nitrosocaldus sp.]
MRSSVNIVVSLPLNDTLTNLLIYEGLIYLMSKVNASIEANKITIPADGFAKAYSELCDEILNKININTVGNDKGPIEKFLKGLEIKGIEEILESLSPDEQRKGKSRVTNYRELLYILKRSSEKLRPVTDSIFIGATIKTDMIIGDVKDDKGIALQLLKTERYTGLTSTEQKYTNRQLKTYVSPEALMLALLGVYSSFVYRSASTYYFLFLSPIEIGEILSKNKDAEKIIGLKNEVREVLEQILKKHFKEEFIALEIYINAKLQEALAKHYVRSISLLLLRVDQENYTYKMYEAMPLTIFRQDRTSFTLVREIIAPDSIILERLSNSDNVEYNNLVAVIVGLYRFIVLKDRYGMYQALRELHDAYIKVRSDDKLKSVTRKYETLLWEVSRLEKHLWKIM